MSNLLPADYVLLGMALVMMVTGLFRGFSGTLAFVLAVVAAAAIGFFGWAYSAAFTAKVWMRVGGTLTAVLLGFGIVRIIVRKLVNGLLAQPSDAIFGALVGAALAALVALAWAWSGRYLEYSVLVKRLSTCLWNG